MKVLMIFEKSICNKKMHVFTRSKNVAGWWYDKEIVKAAPKLAYSWKQILADWNKCDRGRNKRDWYGEREKLVFGTLTRSPSL